MLQQAPEEAARRQSDKRDQHRWGEKRLLLSRGLLPLHTHNTLETYKTHKTHTHAHTYIYTAMVPSHNTGMWFWVRSNEQRKNEREGEREREKGEKRRHP